MASVLDIIFRSRDDTGAGTESVRRRLMGMNRDFSQWFRILAGGFIGMMARAFVKTSIEHSAFAKEFKSKTNDLSASWGAFVGTMGNTMAPAATAVIGWLDKILNKWREVTAASRQGGGKGGKQPWYARATNFIQDVAAYWGAKGTGLQSDVASYEQAMGDVRAIADEQIEANEKLKKHLENYARWKEWNYGRMYDIERMYFDDSLKAYEDYEKQMRSLKMAAWNRADVTKEPNYAMLSDADKDQRKFMVEQLLSPDARKEQRRTERAKAREDKKLQAAINRAYRKRDQIRQGLHRDWTAKDEMAMKIEQMGGAKVDPNTALLRSIDSGVQEMKKNVGVVR